jgi:hypothetical protein
MMVIKKKSGSDSSQPPTWDELRHRLKNQESIRERFGTVEWEGDLHQMRKGRFPEQGIEVRRTLPKQRRRS